MVSVRPRMKETPCQARLALPIRSTHTPRGHRQGRRRGRRTRPGRPMIGPSADMKPWWEAFPGRAKHEYECLDAAGIRYALDNDAADRSVLQLRITAIGDDAVDLIATFPDLYPFFRPAVRLAVDGDMRHHQHPFSGDLCLLGRRTSAWSTGDTLAWLLTTQLPRTLRAGRAAATADRARGELVGLEEVQAEPFSEYYTFASNAVILVDGGWSLPPTRREGALDLRVMRMPATITEGMVAAVLAVQGEDGTALATLSGHHPERFPHPLRGRWVRLDAPVAQDDPEAIWAAVKNASPVVAASWQPLPLAGGTHVQVTGVVFPEERSHRVHADGWMFLVRVRDQGRQPPRRSRRGGRPLPPTQTAVATHLVRAGYAGESDLAGRVPELTGLATKQVAVIGLGAIGGAVAEQLSRAGVGHLTLVDRDRVEPGNLVRHVATMPTIGWAKAQAVGELVLTASPQAVCEVHEQTVGGVRIDAPPPSEQDGLAELIDAADLVIDCTAEKGVQQALAWLCARRATDLVVASGTSGGWGGRVVQFRQRQGVGCWSCLEHAIGEDGSPLTPPAAPDNPVQPAGCADPTFTGTGFDLVEVSLHTVRLAVGLLQRDAGRGYPEAEHDVYVLALRDSSGRLVPPIWTGHPLPVHPACTGHKAGA